MNVPDELAAMFSASPMCSDVALSITACGFASGGLGSGGVGVHEGAAGAARARLVAMAHSAALAGTSRRMNKSPYYVMAGELDGATVPGDRALLDSSGRFVYCLWSRL